VIKHAKATEVTLKVGFDAEVLRASVVDDGCGFDSSTASGGSGLGNMKRRLTDIGGTCDIGSQPGKGTKVEMSLAV